MALASKTVPRQLVRGAVGLAAAVAAIAGTATGASVALLLLVVTAVAWRGCPTCWAIGLLQTVGRHRLERPAGPCPGPPARAGTTCRIRLRAGRGVGRGAAGNPVGVIGTVKNVVSGVVGTAAGVVRGGGADRSEAAQKAAATRAAAARKRSQAARKGAQTRAEQAQSRSDAAKKAARTRSRKTAQRKSRVDAMVDAVRDD